MKNFKIALVLLAVLGWIGSAGALPIDNTNQYLSPGVLYGTYTNSGSLLLLNGPGESPIVLGNNLGSPTRLSYVESLVQAQPGLSGIQLAITNNVTYTPAPNEGGRTGTWATTPPVDAISFYVVKAGNAFAMYRVLDPENDGSTGSWSTYDIWMSGLKGTGGEGGLSISHFTGYNPTPSTSVPEPATMLLFGAGAIVFGGYIRRKRINK